MERFSEGIYTFYTYILTNKNRTVLYTGVTNNLKVRLKQHKEKLNPNSFTAKYNVNLLVYFETFQYINDAIDREKQLKKWNRQWKINLIEEENKDWKDLSEDWFN